MSTISKSNGNDWDGATYKKVDNYLFNVASPYNLYKINSSNVDEASVSSDKVALFDGSLWNIFSGGVRVSTENVVSGSVVSVVVLAAGAWEVYKADSVASLLQGAVGRMNVSELKKAVYRYQGETGVAKLVNMWGQEPLYRGDFWRVTPGFYTGNRVEELKKTDGSYLVESDLAAGKYLVCLGGEYKDNGEWGSPVWRVQDEPLADGVVAAPGTTDVSDMERYLWSFDRLVEQGLNMVRWDLSYPYVNTSLPVPFKNFTGVSEVDGLYYRKGLMPLGFCKVSSQSGVKYYLNGSEYTGSFPVVGETVATDGETNPTEGKNNRGEDQNETRYDNPVSTNPSDFVVVDGGELLDGVYDKNEYSRGDNKLYSGGVLKSGYWLEDKPGSVDVLYENGVRYSGELAVATEVKYNDSGEEVSHPLRYYENGVMSTGVSGNNLFVGGELCKEAYKVYEQKLYALGVLSEGEYVWLDVLYEDGVRSVGEEMCGDRLYNNGYLYSGFHVDPDDVKYLYKDGLKYTGVYEGKYYVDGVLYSPASFGVKLGLLYGSDGSLSSDYQEFEDVLYYNGGKCVEKFKVMPEGVAYYYGDKFSGEYTDEGVRKLYGEDGKVKVPSGENKFEFGVGSGEYLYSSGVEYTGVYTTAILGEGGDSGYTKKQNYIKGELVRGFSEKEGLMFYDGETYTGQRGVQDGSDGRKYGKYYNNGVLEELDEENPHLWTEMHPDRVRVTEMIPEQDNELASKRYVDSTISGLVDGAVGSLDTLKELALSLNDNEDMASSLVKSVAEAKTSLELEMVKSREEEEKIKSMLAEERVRAQDKERRLSEALDEEKKRAMEESSNTRSLLAEEVVRAKEFEKRLEDSKFPKSVGLVPKYSVHEPTGNLQIAQDAYLMVGTRWRMSANTEYNDHKRFVFEYKARVNDETSWQVAIPFIAAAGGGGR
jgi:hypothetical protein